MTTEIYRAVSIIEERVFEGNVFPFTLTSSLRKDIFCNELKSNDNRLELDNLLRNHKAVLFRDIQGLTSAEDFNDIITATGYLGMDYIGGAAVRTQLTDRVFTANESPASEVIPFHHEMAQTPHPPTHLFFFCERPPTTGGETPILISSIVYQRMVEKHPLFMAKLEELGVKYVRFLPEEDDPTSAIGRGWRSTFLCQDRESAERSLESLGSTWEWLADGSLKTVTATLPAIRDDIGEQRSQQKTFFNSVVAAYTGWNDSRNSGPLSVLTGDDLPLDPVAMRDAVAIMGEVSVAFKWQAGDVLLLDNRTVMHSRNSYEGPRRILAGLVRDPNR